MGGYKVIDDKKRSDLIDNLYDGLIEMHNTLQDIINLVDNYQQELQNMKDDIGNMNE